MGRTDALANSDTQALVQWLRRLHERRWCSYGQLAIKTELLGVPTSSSTLWRAVQGRSTPAWPTVEAFTRACDGDVG